MSSSLPTIGRNALLAVTHMDQIPAKVDTGADSSSLWASDIIEADGKISFVLCDPSSSYYTGERITADYSTVRVRSSSGRAKQRYVAFLPVQINGVACPMARFTLADRATMMYPALIGRQLLENTFVVDVAQQLPGDVESRLRTEKKQRAAQRQAALQKEA